MSENTAATVTPTPYHWVMTVQTSDGRTGTSDGRVDVIPGVHTPEGTYTKVREWMQDWIGVNTVTVLFYSISPNQF